MAGVTRASVTYSGQKVTVRNKTKAAGMIALGGITAVALCGGGVNAVLHGRALGAAIAVPIASAVIFYAAWLVAWRMSIRLAPEGIVIENCIIRYTIPWRQGRQFVVSNGLKLRLLDGRIISVWAFQGSFGSQLIGYAAHVPIRDLLVRECDRIVMENPPSPSPLPDKWRLQLPDWWIPLAVACVAEGIVWLAELASHK